MSEIGPIIKELWDHDAAERGEGPQQWRLRCKSVAPGEDVAAWTAHLADDARIVADVRTRIWWYEPVREGRSQQTDKPALEVEWVKANSGQWKATVPEATLNVYPLEQWPGIDSTSWRWTVLERGSVCSGYCATREAAQSAAEESYRRWRAEQEGEVAAAATSGMPQPENLAQQTQSQDDGFADLVWRLHDSLWWGSFGDDFGCSVGPSKVGPLWQWQVAVGDEDGSDISGYARTEDEAKRAAYDAWREFEDLRRGVAADATQD